MTREGAACPPEPCLEEDVGPVRQRARSSWPGRAFSKVGADAETAGTGVEASGLFQTRQWGKLSEEVTGKSVPKE